MPGDRLQLPTSVGLLSACNHIVQIVVGSRPSLLQVTGSRAAASTPASEQRQLGRRCRYFTARSPAARPKTTYEPRTVTFRNRNGLREETHKRSRSTNRSAKSPCPGIRIRKCHLSRKTRAPLRNRTVDLLLTIYAGAYAVAASGIAGQVTGGPRCCSPTYMVINCGPAASLCRNPDEQ